ncbi:MAG: hypothetical protein LBM04_13295, partial [Opitutaceae bacterium]|nr:hypothetical protein [Opitutaceae bacterium]
PWIPARCAFTHGYGRQLRFHPLPSPPSPSPQPQKPRQPLGRIARLVPAAQTAPHHRQPPAPAIRLRVDVPHKLHAPPDKTGSV